MVWMDIKSVSVSYLELSEPQGHKVSSVAFLSLFVVLG